MARSSEIAMVLIAGPQIGGDEWGDRWAEETSPGSVLVEAEIDELHDDGSATLRIGDLTRHLPEGTGLYEYRRIGDIDHAALRQLRDSLAPLLSDPNQAVATVADTIRAMVTGTGRKSAAQTLVNVALNTGRPEVQRTQALILIGLLLAADGAEL